jgi:hypothetical protein
MLVRNSPRFADPVQLVRKQGIGPEGLGGFRDCRPIDGLPSSWRHLEALTLPAKPSPKRKNEKSQVPGLACDESCRQWRFALPMTKRVAARLCVI